MLKGWEGLGAGGEGDDRGWDGWMASPTLWTWVWVNSRSWWWTGRQAMPAFGEGNGTPLQYSCLENPMDGGAWYAAVHGVAKSRTWLSDFTLTFHFHALEEEMATHSSVLAWRIPWTEEPGGLPSMGSHRVGHDWSDLAAGRPGVLQFMGRKESDTTGRLNWTELKGYPQPLLDNFLC